MCPTSGYPNGACSGASSAKGPMFRPEYKIAIRTGLKALRYIAVRDAKRSIRLGWKRSRLISPLHQGPARDHRNQCRGLSSTFSRPLRWMIETNCKAGPPGCHDVEQDGTCHG